MYIVKCEIGIQMSEQKKKCEFEPHVVVAENFVCKLDRVNKMGKKAREVAMLR